MGIVNINALKNNDAARVQQMQAEAHIQALVDAHRRGEHPFGRMRRDCPLCQKS